IEAARRRPRITSSAQCRLAGTAPAAVSVADAVHARRTITAVSEAGCLMNDGGILGLRVQARSALTLRINGQRAHAQSERSGSQCNRELSHRLPSSVKDQKVLVKHDPRRR